MGQGKKKQTIMWLWGSKDILTLLVGKGGKTIFERKSNSPKGCRKTGGDEGGGLIGGRENLSLQMYW